MCESRISRRVLCAVAVAALVMSADCILDLHLRKCSLPCKVPQPRSIRVAELVNSPYETYPYMTVIHRCDEGTGCCKTREMCQMAKFEELKVGVLALVKKKYKYMVYTIRNHTECSCQNRDNDIK